MALCFIGLSFLEFVEEPPLTRFSQRAPPNRRHILSTTLPKGLPSIWYRSASAASSRANVRATIGFMAPDSSNVKIDAQAVLHISIGCAKSEKLFMLARFQMRSVTSIVDLRPAE